MTRPPSALANIINIRHEYRVNTIVQKTNNAAPIVLSHKSTITNCAFTHYHYMFLREAHKHNEVNNIEQQNAIAPSVPNNP